MFAAIEPSGSTACSGFTNGSPLPSRNHHGIPLIIGRMMVLAPTIVGTVESLATEAAALKAAHALRIDANQQTPLAEGGPKTIAELIAHYRLKELVGEKQGRKAFSTRAGYESYLKGTRLRNAPFLLLSICDGLCL